LRQLGQDKQSSAAVRYQSLVMGWTVYQHKFRLAFKIHSLIYITVGSDTATNTQAGQSPARCLQAYRHSAKLLRKLI